MCAALLSQDLLMLASFRRHLGSWVARLFFLLLVATFVLWGVGDVIRNLGNDSAVATVAGRSIEMPQVQEASAKHSSALVDVRSPQEFTGQILAPPGLPETCQRGAETLRPGGCGVGSDI